MNKCSRENLQDALISLKSLLSKCQKAMDSTKLKPSQETLLINRIRALEIAVHLIEVEIRND